MGRKGMMKIIVLRTSSDPTIQRLFKEILTGEKKSIDCLIQHSQIDRYRELYPDIDFIDIYQERFEDLRVEAIGAVYKKKYDQMYITLSGVNAYDLWNVISFVRKLHYKQGFFYDRDGGKFKIPRKNFIKDLVFRAYIKWVRSMTR